MLKQLHTEINALKSEQSTALEQLTAKLQDEYNKVFDADSKLQADIAKLQESKEYGSDDLGIYAWIRINFDLPDDEAAKPYLESYLQDQHCIGIDFANSALLLHLGPCIIVNDDGDVLDEDSGQWIVDASEYTVDGEQDLEVRNSLIEAWMTKHGYFPGVFSMDRYGNVFLIDTLKGAK